MDTLASWTRRGAMTSLAYDANGNLATKSGGWSYGWGAENLMANALLNNVRQQAYTYDGLGRRVKVDGAGGTNAWTVSAFSGLDPVYEKDDGGGVTKYVLANGMRVARITPSGAVQYYLADHEGSTRKVLDASRNVLFSTDYEPFGTPYSVSGTEAYTYTGEKHDDPTGLVYLRARQYDPEVGRFVSADPVLGSLAAPQTLNRYTYTVNNPLKYTDPSGEFPFLILLAIVLIGAGTGAGLTVLAPDVAKTYVDPIMMLIGPVPVLGDFVSDPYFAARSVTSCALGACDALNVGTDVGSLLLPGGSVSSLRRAGSAGLGLLAGITRAGNRAEDLSGLGRGRHTVYTLVDESGDVKYVGRTTRSADVRLLEHQRGWRAREFKNLDIRETFEGLTYAQARGLEHRLFIDHGGKKALLNLISPIGILNPGRAFYLDAADAYLRGLA